MIRPKSAPGKERYRRYDHDREIYASHSDQDMNAKALGADISSLRQLFGEFEAQFAEVENDRVRRTMLLRLERSLDEIVSIHAKKSLRHTSSSRESPLLPDYDGGGPGKFHPRDFDSVYLSEVAATGAPNSLTEEGREARRLQDLRNKNGDTAGSYNRRTHTDGQKSPHLQRQDEMYLNNKNAMSRREEISLEEKVTKLESESAKRRARSKREALETYRKNEGLLRFNNNGIVGRQSPVPPSSPSSPSSGYSAKTPTNRYWSGSKKTQKNTQRKERGLTARSAEFKRGLLAWEEEGEHNTRPKEWRMGHTLSQKKHLPHQSLEMTKHRVIHGGSSKTRAEELQRRRRVSDDATPKGAYHLIRERAWGWDDSDDEIMNPEPRLHVTSSSHSWRTDSSRFHRRRKKKHEIAALREGGDSSVEESSAQQEYDVEEIEALLFDKMETKGLGGNIFMRCDLENSGHINEGQLRSVVAAIGVSLSDNEIACLLNTYRHLDDEKAFDYKKFLRNAEDFWTTAKRGKSVSQLTYSEAWNGRKNVGRGESSRAIRGGDDDLELQHKRAIYMVRDRLHQKGSKAMRQLFQELSRDGHSVPLLQLAKFLAREGVREKPEALAKLCENWGFDRSLSHKDFVRFFDLPMVTYGEGAKQMSSEQSYHEEPSFERSADVKEMMQKLNCFGTPRQIYLEFTRDRSQSALAVPQLLAGLADLGLSEHVIQNLGFVRLLESYCNSKPGFMTMAEFQEFVSQGRRGTIIQSSSQKKRHMGNQSEQRKARPSVIDWAGETDDTILKRKEQQRKIWRLAELRRQIEADDLRIDAMKKEENRLREQERQRRERKREDILSEISEAVYARGGLQNTFREIAGGKKKLTKGKFLLSMDLLEINVTDEQASNVFDSFCDETASASGGLTFGQFVKLLAAARKS